MARWPRPRSGPRPNWAAIDGPGDVLAQAVHLHRLRRGRPDAGPVPAAGPGAPGRGHLLWTLNPLLLWEIVAGGHIDGLSAAFGLLGVLLLTTGRNGERPARYRFLLASLFIGIAAAIKIPYAAFGLGVVWAGVASRPRPWRPRSAVFAVIFIPVYAAAGHPAASALI